MIKSAVRFPVTLRFNGSLYKAVQEFAAQRETSFTQAAFDLMTAGVSVFRGVAKPRSGPNPVDIPTYAKMAKVVSEVEEREKRKEYNRFLEAIGEPSATKVEFERLEEPQDSFDMRGGL